MPDAIDAWVRRVNLAARNLDELAASMHPSAWAEALHEDTERFKRLAVAGPQSPRDEYPEVRA